MSIDKTSIIRAKDVMNKKLVIIDGMATSREAVAKMRSENVFSLLVNKRSPDDSLAIVVYQDIVRGVIVPDISPDDVHVYEIMTKPVITVPADMDVRYVARLIYNAGIRRAPVEDKGEILGMVSLASLVLENKLF
ncbi:Histidine kinase [Candidatus Magnetomoraceae bacterium gMMP-15]